MAPVDNVTGSPAQTANGNPPVPPSRRRRIIIHDSSDSDDKENIRPVGHDQTHEEVVGNATAGAPGMSIAVEWQMRSL